jgi:MFS family permease
MAASSRPQSVSVYPILSVNFVGTLGFSIVLPFLVFLITRLGGNALIYGVMGATYSFFQLIGAPILGRWSDRFGRRRILLLSQLGTLASWAIFLAALLLPVLRSHGPAGRPVPRQGPGRDHRWERLGGQRLPGRHHSGG